MTDEYEYIQNLETRRRQALHKLRSALDKIIQFDRSLGPPPPPAPEPWTCSRLRGIREDVGDAYDLLAELVDPDNLLDEMASL